MEVVTDCKTYMVEGQKTHEKWPAAKFRISQFSLKIWRLNWDTVIGRYEFHLLKWVLATACLSLFSSLAGVHRPPSLKIYWNIAHLSHLYIYHHLQVSECHVCTRALICRMVQCRHIQTSLCSTSLWLPVHLPSSVWGFLSAVDFKLLARPLDLMVAACLLCIHVPLSLVEHPQQALFLLSLILGLKGIASPCMLFSVVWCVFIPVSFSEISVPSPPLP